LLCSNHYLDLLARAFRHKVITLKKFEILLEESVKAHGHLCAGQVIGVRMAMLGCRLVGIDEPKSPLFRKQLIVYVEIDRCATDAISSVTGCQLGKRTLKFTNYGINAATFLNLTTNKAYRIVSTEQSRDLAAKYAPDATTLQKAQLEGYKVMPDNLLFNGYEVKVQLDDSDMPGPPKSHMVCETCGQMVRDGREIVTNIDGKAKTICRPCSKRSYFSPLRRVELQ